MKKRSREEAEKTLRSEMTVHPGDEAMNHFMVTIVFTTEETTATTFAETRTATRAAKR